VSGALVIGHVVVLGLASGLALHTTERSLPVVLPLAVAGAGAGVFYLALRLWRRSASPFFEVGGVYVGVVTLYTVYPLLNFLLIGLAYTRFSESRLSRAAPGPEEVGLIGWYHVLHLLVFGGAYLLARGGGDHRVRLRSVEAPTLIASVAAFAAITGYFGFLGLFYDLSASTYVESYLVMRRLPLLLAQLANHLAGARFVLELVILAALFANYRRWRWVIGAWLAVATVLAVATLGSRTEIVLRWMAAAVIYDLTVRRLGIRRLLPPAVAGLVAFQVFGLVRGGMLLLSEPYPILFGSPTELEVVFGTTVHLNQLAASAEPPAPPLGVVWSDLLALIPQQVSPIPKLNPADWYVQTYFPAYAASGGGLVFGTIPESLVSDGVFGIVWRAGLLGLVLGRFHACVSPATGRLWPMVLYVWVTVSVYQSFRASTFILLGYLFYRFVPVALAVGLLSHALKVIAARAPRSGSVTGGAAA
jgi:hypothetical protein